MSVAFQHHACMAQHLRCWTAVGSCLPSSCGRLQVVIFVKSVARARELSKLLIDCNFPAICIHSAMGQEERCALCQLLSLLWQHHRGHCSCV